MNHFKEIEVMPVALLSGMMLRSTFVMDAAATVQPLSSPLPRPNSCNVQDLWSSQMSPTSHLLQFTLQ